MAWLRGQGSQYVKMLAEAGRALSRHGFTVGERVLVDSLSLVSPFSTCAGKARTAVHLPSEKVRSRLVVLGLEMKPQSAA